MTSQSVRLYQKKNSEQCWAPKCKNKGQPFTLSYENGEADVILCEKHGEEATAAGQ